MCPLRPDRRGIPTELEIFGITASIITAIIAAAVGIAIIGPVRREPAPTDPPERVE